MLLEKWDTFINELRTFFRGRGYLEVSTPVLLKFPNLDSNVEPIPVEVKRRGRKETLWLQTSPEYSMKKILAEYKRHIFQIAKVFRNDEHGRLHRLEFHMLEWYRIGADYRYLIEEIKELLRELFGYEEFEEISVSEAFEKHLGIELGEDEKDLKASLKDKGIHFQEEEGWETLFYRAFIEVERRLGFDKPTFLKDFPERLSALARVEGGLANRFELFIKGIEIANGWTEETDPEEVRRRMKTEAEKRNLPIDEEFIAAHHKIPPCAGCSIGVNRLFMLWVGKETLNDIELFNHEPL
ncbi:lysyl-tRNA synthetase [Hydrogenivirga sp. 128-5-R1-1]|nr:lysyl-tRNA synthetase [Hydrogenivirga sp. 128-5-R1-1]